MDVIIEDEEEKESRCGYAVILETGMMIFYDEAQVKDISAEVKAKLGVSATATAPAAATK